MTEEQLIQDYDCRLCKWNSYNPKYCNDDCAGNYRHKHFELSQVPICIDGKWYNPEELMYNTNATNKID